MPINYPNLIDTIDTEISRLQQARKLLAGSSNTGTATRKQKSNMSAEARARISAAQKKRWANWKRTGK